MVRAAQPIRSHALIGAFVSRTWNPHRGRPGNRFTADFQLDKSNQPAHKLIPPLKIYRSSSSDDYRITVRMAPKKNAAAAAAAAQAQQATTTVASTPSSTKATAAANTGRANWDEVLKNLYNYYMKETPQRTKLIDVFLFFLVIVAALQFLYCVLAGNYVCGILNLSRT